ncbi:MAG: amidase [Desulfomonile tiedjei]|nr:amidase [Desulfomonile tiedjei]
MANFDEIAFLDATTQAELVRNKEIAPAELVEAAIERIERLNPSLNAVITPMYDQARQRATGPIPVGPFSGVPFLMKDIIAFCEGVRMAMGTPLLCGFVPDHDSELTLRFKKAGLIALGKTNTPEFGLLPTTEPVAFGPTRNPWDTERTTGGSSGGSAAAVASGMVPMAHANDGGGSIRIPASCCGVFGLKPTRARNPLGPDFGDILSGLVCEHAVTRSVRDSAALLDATAGPDIGDPYCAPLPRRPFLEEVGADPGRLRIALSSDFPFGRPPHEDCMTAIKETAALCESLGHVVEEAAPSMTRNSAEETGAFIAIWAAGCAATVDTIAAIGNITPTEQMFEPLTFAIYQQGREISASRYLRAVTTLQRLTRDMARFFADYDVMLTPVLAEPPVPLGTFDAPKDNPMKAWERVVAFAPYTALFNATGQPAMSVPLFWNKDGLPIGSHFVGRFGDEPTLFRLAAQLEQARPWASRRPRVFA